MTSRAFGDVVVELVRGDITHQPDLDAIVNAANAQLAPGGGVAGAIHAAAGPGLYEECRLFAPIETGEAVITGGHDLPNPHVIHTLGPVYSRSANPAAELAESYRGSLHRADELALRSIGFPAVSTGIFGYPMEEAAQVSLWTIAETAPALRAVRLVRFVLLGARDLDVYRNALAELA